MRAALVLLALPYAVGWPTGVRLLCVSFRLEGADIAELLLRLQGFRMSRCMRTMLNPPVVI